MKHQHIRRGVTALILTAAVLLTAGGCSGSSGQRRTVKPSAPESSTASGQGESSLWVPTSSAPASQVSKEEEPKSIYPKDWDDKGIFSEYYEKAYKTVRDMPLDEKIGQMIYSSCPDKFEGDFARENHLGGFVLFGKDFSGKTKDEVQQNIKTYLYAESIPMTLAVDEEGGDVTRISDKYALYDHIFQSPRTLYQKGGLELLKQDAEEKAQMLSDYGIVVNLAPVCDISTNTKDFMYSRSLGEDAKTTAEYVKLVTEASQAKGVSVTLKHFPGYGSNGDTHTDVVVDSRDYEEFEKNDFLPFQAGIDAGAHLVLVSHNIVNCMDSEKPASLSPAVHKVLREKLGFTGIIVTDDLSMQAIAKYTGEHSVAVEAVLAGNDMLMLGSSMVPDAIASIKQAVEDGTIPETTIDHAVTRIIAWKLSKNMM